MNMGCRGTASVLPEPQPRRRPGDQIEQYTKLHTQLGQRLSLARRRPVEFCYGWTTLGEFCHIMRHFLNARTPHQAPIVEQSIIYQNALPARTPNPLIFDQSLPTRGKSFIFNQIISRRLKNSARK
jgi:hypothetical protein